MIQFVMLWAGVALAAAVVALLPRAPRKLRLLADAVLLMVGTGNWLGARTTWLPVLNREITAAPFWNHLPLEQRRVLAWNLLGSLAFAWLMIPYLVFVLNDSGPRGAALIGKIVVFLLVWIMAGILFVTIAYGMMFL